MQKRSWISMTSLQVTEWLNYMLVIVWCLFLSYPGGAVPDTMWFSHQIAAWVFERPRGGCIENLSKTNVQTSKQQSVNIPWITLLIKKKRKKPNKSLFLYGIFNTKLQLNSFSFCLLPSFLHDSSSADGCLLRLTFLSNVKFVRWMICPRTWDQLKR